MAFFVPLNRPLIFHDIEGLGFPFATHLILAFSFSKMLRSVVVSTSEIIGGDITRRYDIWKKNKFFFVKCSDFYILIANF